MGEIALEAENPPSTEASSTPLYYIEDGVHRAVALRENGVQTPIPAVLFASRQAPTKVFASLSQLYSPRSTVSKMPTGRHDLPAMIAWLSAKAGRAKMPPLHVQPLGEAGQTSSIPLSQVQII